MTKPDNAAENWAPIRTKPEHADAPDYEFCGFCAHHADSHIYQSHTGVVPCAECPEGVCTRDD
jgi:hypothetical protein